MARLVCCLFSIWPMQVFDQLDISGGTTACNGANRNLNTSSRWNTWRDRGEEKRQHGNLKGKYIASPFTGLTGSP